MKTQQPENASSKSVYATSAYSSKKIVRQEKPNKKGLWQRLFTSGQNFSFSKPSTVIATNVVLRKIWINGEIKKASLYNTQETPPWDEQKIEHECPTRSTSIYLSLSECSEVVCLFLYPLVVFSSFMVFLLSADMTFIDMMIDIVKITLFIFLPMALLWGQFELLKRGYFTLRFLNSRKQFILNRQTGMVTLYKSNGDVCFSHPFLEFDCFLVSSPNYQGILFYGLHLRHRYNGYAQGIPLSALMDSCQEIPEQQALWNMIQRYMDVSQPLPDTFLLEAARERDPTTAKFDSRGHRGHPSHYWRDMDYKSTLEVLNEIRMEQYKSPLVGARMDIFKTEK